MVTNSCFRFWFAESYLLSYLSNEAKSGLLCSVNPQPITPTPSLLSSCLAIILSSCLGLKCMLETSKHFCLWWRIVATHTHYPGLRPKGNLQQSVHAMSTMKLDCYLLFTPTPTWTDVQPDLSCTDFCLNYKSFWSNSEFLSLPVKIPGNVKATSNLLWSPRSLQVSVLVLFFVYPQNRTLMPEVL